ncbi:putative PAS protein [Candidatus Terasakiella magnetica]|uniref:histidine kinase n=1 Tax=Candidatus Terasakiella magnetica TaxID=1867952 RepID=A0A1C3RKF3_9PROT|nr:ATP-binding protein [Candidatus Terasakiella magnetica]SCA57718.1 putative PAS protein [Candidatus Terasakiella magnetica]
MLTNIRKKISHLSFRWKAIVFIASVEGLFNIMFAIIVVSVMQNNLEEQFFKRAQTTAQIFAKTTTNAVLATDIASLESFVEEVMTNNDIRYARVIDTSDVLVEHAHDQELLKRSFVADTNLGGVDDNVFDTFATISEDGEVYGRVEIGLSTDLLGSTITQIQLKVILTGVGEIVFSAIVSFLLGTFLVRRLIDLQKGSKKIAQGDFDFRINDEGGDELAATARAFNDMSSKVNSLVHGLKQANTGLDEKRLMAENDLQLAQARLIQASKMEALGTLSGGIAHEINTPTQYIGDNLIFLRDASQNMIQMVSLCRELCVEARKNGVLVHSVDEIEKFTESIEMDFLIEEIEDAIKQSVEGVGEVSRIVRTMKDFSHPGSVEKSHVDLHELLETTISVSKNEWKYVAELEHDFAADLPKVSCYPGELKQVFLNLIVNAAHAIGALEKDNQDGVGKIQIATKHQDGWVEVLVNDTGGGIPHKIKQRVFDPFFTTKDVGQGTGQGLAIAFDIVQNKHGGVISFESEEGQGTSFMVRLPIS